ncbi:MAG: hypothetical protein HY644_13490 [Acidobacteria bacterium]|nr:hypothetical protein [Acidobacteriota bacterium]
MWFRWSIKSLTVAGSATIVLGLQDEIRRSETALVRFVTRDKDYVGCVAFRNDALKKSVMQTSKAKRKPAAKVVASQEKKKKKA